MTPGESCLSVGSIEALALEVKDNNQGFRPLFFIFSSYLFRILSLACGHFQLSARCRG